MRVCRGTGWKFYILHPKTCCNFINQLKRFFFKKEKLLFKNTIKGLFLRFLSSFFKCYKKIRDIESIWFYPKIWPPWNPNPLAFERISTSHTPVKAPLLIFFDMIIFTLTLVCDPSFMLKWCFIHESRQVLDERAINYFRILTINYTAKNNEGWVNKENYFT